MGYLYESSEPVNYFHMQSKENFLSFYLPRGTVLNFPVLVIPTDILGGNLDAESLLHFIALCGSNYLQSKTDMMSAYSINKIYLNINM
jgi:hypothetical protein